MLESFYSNGSLQKDEDDEGKKFLCHYSLQSMQMPSMPKCQMPNSSGFEVVRYSLSEALTGHGHIEIKTHKL